MFGRKRRVKRQVAILVALFNGPDGGMTGIDLYHALNLSWSGNLYPDLARLERSDWINSHWEMTEIDQYGEEILPRRRYRLTVQGLSRVLAAKNRSGKG